MISTVPADLRRQVKLRFILVYIAHVKVVGKCLIVAVGKKLPHDRTASRGGRGDRPSQKVVATGLAFGGAERVTCRSSLRRCPAWQLTIGSSHLRLRQSQELPEHRLVGHPQDIRRPQNNSTTRRRERHWQLTLSSSTTI